MYDLVRAFTRPDVMVFMIPIFAIFMGCMVAIVKMLTSQGATVSKEGRRANAAEASEIQELHRGFEELTRRVESLETILLEKARKG